MKKLLKAALALMMVFAIQIATLGSIDAVNVNNLPDGKYTVLTKLKNAGNIANDSMAAGALAENGELSVEEGKWYLIAEFKTLNMMGLVGNAKDIKYYETDTKSEKHDAQIISYRNDDQSVQQVEKVKIPVAVNSEGVYIEMLVDAMGMTVDAYIQYSTADIVIPEPEAPEYTLADGTYKKADITSHDTEGNISELQFTLATNKKLTNVKFYYGGSTRGSDARLSLGLDNPTPVVSENTSKFVEDGTYTVDIVLWNATQDKISMAASAIDSKATVVVNDGIATMYITTKEMTMGTVKAWLEELYIGSSDSNYKANPATIISKNTSGKATMWSFILPSEEELFDVVVNPHVAMMGNSDIPARMKVDYSTLTKVSDSTDTPKVPDTDTGNSGNTTTPNTTPTNNQTTGTTNSLVKTGDNASSKLMGGLLISSLAIAGYLTRKRLCK